MKKNTFLLIFVLLGFYSFGQTTVTIGTGTAVSAAGANGSPIYRSSAISTFNFSQSVELLTATDLSAVGITAGSTITKIAYKKLNAFTMSPGRTATMKVYMKNSATTVLGTTTNFATYTTGSTLCYNNAAFSNVDIPAVAGWVEYVFTTPFNYTGGSIEVGLDFAVNAGAGNPTDGGFTWEYTIVTANQAAGISNNVPITGNLTTAQPRIYNTQLTYTNSPCTGIPAPGNTVVSPSSICFGSSATLSLQNSTIGSGVTYQWYLNAVAIGGATSATYTIASVTSSDTYYCDVTCAGNTTTSNSLSVGPTIISAPLLEPFATFLPNCWTNMFGGDVTTGPTASTGSGWVADGFANSGTTGAIRNEIWTTGANDWLVSPVINIPASGYELKFDAAATQWNVTGLPTTPWESDDFIEVLVSTTGLTNWTPIFTYNDSNQPSNTGTPNILDLNAYAGQNIRIAFRAVEGATNGAADIDFSFDNFQVRLTPTCPDQTGLTLGTVTATTADFSWDDLNLGGALGYEYAITTSATPPALGTSTTATIYSATGLSPQTVYYMHVRTSCAAATFGNWATVTFTTACAPFSVPVLETFNTFLPNTCWTEADNGDLTTGPLTFGSGSWLVDGFGNVGTTGAARVTLDAAADNDWIISSEFTIPASGYELKFDAAATQGGTVNTPTTPWESDDFVEVLVSTTSTTNWTVLFSYNDTNSPSNTGSTNIIDLDAYSGQNIRFAFRAVEGVANGAASIDFSIDNFQIRLTPPCPDQTGLTLGTVTATTADFSWDDLNLGGALGYEYAITTSATPPASGTSTTATIYSATGLSPQTVYYLHVRSECSGSTYGAWATTTFTTACVAITTLPHIEGFDAVANPNCWATALITGATNWAPDTDNDGVPSPRTGSRFAGKSWVGNDDALLISPLYNLSAYPTDQTQINVWIYRSANGLSTDRITFYANTNNNLSGATQLLDIPLPITAAPTVASAGWYNYIVDVPLSFNTAGDFYIIAEGRTTSSFSSYGIGFDDYALELKPACPTPIASFLNVTSSSADLTWAAVSSATLGYEYVLDNVATDPAGSGTSTTALTYSATGLTQLTTYYFHIRSVCSVGTYSTWSTVSFTTLATPPVNDDCLTPIALTINSDYLCGSFTSGSTVGATNSGVEPTLTVTGTPDNDVWYSFVATQTAHRIVLTNVVAVTGTGTDMGIGVFNGPCASLTLVGSSDPNTYNLTSLTPGNTYLVNVYGWYATGANEANATFNICIGTDPALSNISFDKANFVAYPNPVKDVLNLSYKTPISNVRVINLLGQEVLNTKANSNDVQVNMSALNSGAYIVNITVDDTVHTIKVIKE